MCIIAPTFLHDGMGHAQKSTEKSSQANNEDIIDPDSYTVVKPDDDSRKPCAICGEPFVDFWNDDEEEWMYKNAVMNNNKVIILYNNNSFFSIFFLLIHRHFL